MKALLTSPPLDPVPWRGIVLGIAGLWLGPVAFGALGLMGFALLGENSGDPGLALWFFSYSLLLSPFFSWVGWIIALPAIWLALRRGWFGWLPAFGIGAAAGALAQGLVQSAFALPFGAIAVVLLRAVLGRTLLWRVKPQGHFSP